LRWPSAVISGWDFGIGIQLALAAVRDSFQPLPNIRAISCALKGATLPLL
jgi:hypothetical protein